LLARPEGLEPPAYWFEASRSIQLSYGRVASSYHPKKVAREVELEAPESWVDQTARRLGLRRDYVMCSCAALYEEYRRSHATVPRDMKFHLP
jgi:hypothetical protein